MDDFQEIHTVRIQVNIRVVATWNSCYKLETKNLKDSSLKIEIEVLK